MIELLSTIIYLLVNNNISPYKDPFLQPLSYQESPISSLPSFTIYVGLLAPMHTVHTELDYEVFCKDPIPSMPLETSGCYGGIKLVKMNYLDPLPLSSSSMTKLDGESKIPNERTGVTLVKGVQINKVCARPDLLCG